MRIWDMMAHWGAIHTSATTFNWAPLDAIVTQAEANGLKISYVFGATPKWAAAAIEPDYAAWLGPGCNSVPSSIDDWNTFVFEVGRRYAGRIDAYELWNEPQNKQFLNPYTSSNLAFLATMTKSASHILSEVDPSATVLAASVLPRPTSGGMHRATHYLNALKAEGWPIQALNIHTYPELNQGVSIFESYVDEALDTFRSLGAPAHLTQPSNLWITEALYGIDPVVGGINIPESASNALVCGTYTAMATRGIPAEQLIWYAWQAFPGLHGMDIGPGTQAWKAMQQCS